MGTFSRRGARWRAVLVGVAALALVAVAAAESGPGASAATRATSLPTWRNLYDWASGGGYAGWHGDTSSAADYGIDTDHGGEYGLWLWPTGGRQAYVPGDWAEWTYTAPGTTRLESATLSLSYANKLLAHHCVEIGFRAADGSTTDGRSFCGPVKPPDSQGLTTVQLEDPAANPSSKVLYVRIRVDCGGAATCARTIPALDPLANGAFVRVTRVDMTLVDDDAPVVQPSGALWDVRDHFIDGTAAYGVTLSASDAGSGIATTTIAHASQYPPASDTVASEAAPCDPLHTTPALDARICPQSFGWDTTVPTSPYPEGPNTFTESATDVAGNVGSQAWTIYVDRTPPDSVTASGSLVDLAGQTTDGSDQEGVTVTAHDPGADVQKASGIAKVWLDEVGVGTIASSDNPGCTELACPDSYSADFSVDLSGYADGDHTFVVEAADLVGHVTAGPQWTITIASLGDQVAPVEQDVPPPDTGTAAAPGGGADSYDPSTDPDPACDAYADVGVADWCTAGTDALPATAAPVAPAAAAPAVEATTGYAGCGLRAVFWTVQADPTNLWSALEQYNVGSSCGDYYFANEQGPSSKDRPECYAAERASWPANFHAAPVFEWSRWAQWVEDNHETWYDAGVEFRRRMSADGCRPGDRWLVNELPRSWRSTDYSASTNAQVRARIASALHGLYDGGSLGNVQGFTADVVQGQGTADLSVYKAGLKQAYGADVFWRAVGKYVSGFGDEVYNQCSEICVPGETASWIADRSVNPYSYGESFLAAAAPSTTLYGPAKSTLRVHYFPLLNAIWNSPTPVFDSHVSLKQMIRIVRQQIYSARRIAATSVGSAGTIGFAWKESGLGSDDDAAAANQLAGNLAVALRNAYRSGGTAGAACVDNDGTGTFFYGCPPAGKPGASPNAAWNTLKNW